MDRAKKIGYGWMNGKKFEDISIWNKNCVSVKTYITKSYNGMLVVINRFIVNMFSFLTFPPMQTYQPFFSWGKRKMKILCISIVKKSIHSGWTESWEYIYWQFFFFRFVFFFVILNTTHNFFFSSFDGFFFLVDIYIFVQYKNVGREKACEESAGGSYRFMFYIICWVWTISFILGY